MLVAAPAILDFGRIVLNFIAFCLALIYTSAGKRIRRIIRGFCNLVSPVRSTNNV